MKTKTMMIGTAADDRWLVTVLEENTTNVDGIRWVSRQKLHEYVDELLDELAGTSDDLAINDSWHSGIEFRNLQ